MGNRRDPLKLFTIEDIGAARRTEREQCAALVDQMAALYLAQSAADHAAHELRECATALANAAKAIRNRG